MVQATVFYDLAALDGWTFVALCAELLPGMFLEARAQEWRSRLSG